MHFSILVRRCRKISVQKWHLVTPWPFRWQAEGSSFPGGAVGCGWRCAHSLTNSMPLQTRPKYRELFLILNFFSQISKILNFWWKLKFFKQMWNFCKKWNLRKNWKIWNVWKNENILKKNWNLRKKLKHSTPPPRQQEKLSACHRNGHSVSRVTKYHFYTEIL